MNHILSRALQTLLTLWLVLTLAFAAVNLAGDPISLLVSDDASSLEREALRESLGLNAPFLERYGRFLVGVFTGNLGSSFVFDQPALPLLLERAPVTLALVLAAVGLALLIGVPLGVLAAVHRGSVLDRVILTSSALGVSAPTFFVGVVLIFFFSVQLRVLPSQGSSSLAHFVLPAVTLSLGRIALLTRFIRAGVLEELPKDYVRSARAKGLLEGVVVYRHAFRNALLPLVTVLGLQLGGLFAGTVVTESIFALPGMNRVALEGLTRLDYPLILAFTLVSSLVIAGMSFVTDVVYGFVDPRVRYA
jgi:peptide/nickel transport system permease protein